MSTIQFYWVDVFAKKRFEGNQLAVFPEVNGLDGGTMQKIATEMNLSETTFVTGSEVDRDGKISFKTRIFTKNEELPFAGHPTLGTAYVLRQLYGGDEIWLSLKVGKIRVKFSELGEGVTGEMTQKDPSFGKVHDAGTMAGIYGITKAEIDDKLKIQTVSTGNPFIILPVKTLKTIQRLTPDNKAMEEYLKESDAKFIYVVTQETESEESRIHARMLYYGGEDPATGSAAGPATAWLLSQNLIESDKVYSIEQGTEARRPSIIYVRGSKKGEVISNIRVGGKCFIISKGEMTL